MEITNLPFNYGNKQIEIDITEKMNSILQDSDAGEEKEIIKKYLKEISANFQFMIIGESGVGKTSLLKTLFGEAVFLSHTQRDEIIDYRYGDEYAEFQITGFCRRIFNRIDILKGISIIDTFGIDKINNPETETFIRDNVSRSDVLLVMLSAQNPGSMSVWNTIEATDPKKIVFIVSKIDEVTNDLKAEVLERIGRYMGEAGIVAPVFCTSVVKPDCSETEQLRNYIDDEIIANNEGLSKQDTNSFYIREMFAEIKQSFDRRLSQYERDKKIVADIDSMIDDFRADESERIVNLKKEIENVVDREIEEYKNEIIKRMDPKRIKEQFPKGYSDLMDYLNYVNSIYKEKMSGKVNDTVNASVQTLMTDMESVLYKASAILSERENCIGIEDKFYGTLAESKNHIVANVKNTIDGAKKVYPSIDDATKALYDKGMRARKEADLVVGTSTGLGAVAGGVGGFLGAGALAVGTEGMAAVAAGGVAAAGAGVAIGGLILPIIAGAVGAFAIAVLAKKIASACTDPQMDLKFQDALNEFEQDVMRIKEQMKADLTQRIDEMFRSEINGTDRVFVDYRINVSLEGRRIPLLEDHIGEVDQLLGQLRLEDRSTIEN